MPSAERCPECDELLGDDDYCPDCHYCGFHCACRDDWKDPERDTQ